MSENKVPNKSLSHELNSLISILYCDALNAVSLKISLRYVNVFEGTLFISASVKLNLFLTCSRS